MSAAHDDTHAHAAPEQPEVSHPLLWTACLLAIMTFLAWMFFHFLYRGMHIARHGHPIEMHQGGEAEPDHLKLAANRSQDVIDAGAAVYNAKCASCHGAQGNANPTNLKPAPRNFHVDAWRNPNGGGPYALYLVLAKGLGTMPAFPGLTPEQRYAVNHYITQTWVKKYNPANYLEQDPPELVKQIPPPGAVGGHEGLHDPDQIEPKAPVRPLLAGIAATQSQRVQEVRAWVEAAQRAAPPASAPLVARFAALAEERPGLAVAVRSAVGAGDRKAFATLLAGSDGSGAVRPDFSLASADELGALFELLKGGK
jgi:mono/diheme cytochrome c family protein